MAKFKIKFLSAQLSEDKSKTNYLAQTITDFENSQDYPSTITIGETSYKNYDVFSMKHTNFSYTYEEQFSIHSNAQKELTFKMDRYIMREDRREENPFVHNISIGSQLLLVDKDNREHLFTVKTIGFTFKESNMVYSYTCQDSFTYQLTRQNDGYEIKNDIEDEDFIGSYDVDWWVRNKIIPDCNVFYTYIDLKDNFYVDDDFKPQSLTASRNPTSNHIKNAAPFTTDVNGEIVQTGYYATIPFSASGTANSVLISLGDELGLNLNVYEYLNETTNEMYRFFWFEPKKNSTKVSGLVYSPNRDIKDFSLTYKGDSLSSILNVSGPTINDEDITLLPSVTSFFSDWFTSINWKNSTFEEGMFTKACKGFTQIFKNTDTDIPQILGRANTSLVYSPDTINTTSAINEKINCYNNQTWSWYESDNDTVKQIIIPLYGKQQREDVLQFYFDSKYKTINFQNGEDVSTFIFDKNDFTDRVEIQSIFTKWTLYIYNYRNPEAHDPTMSLYKVESGEEFPDDIFRVYDGALDVDEEYKNIPFIVFSYNSSLITPANYSLTNYEIFLNNSRNYTTEDLEFATMADRLPWLENKLIDFSYFYNQKIINQEQLDLINSIFREDLRIANGRLLAYYSEYYAAIHKKTSIMANISSAIDTVGAAFTKLVDSYQTNGSTTTSCTSDLSSAIQALNQTTNTTKNLINFNDTFADYVNKYINTEQLFYKNVYNFRNYFDSKVDFFNENTTYQSYNLEITNETQTDDAIYVYSFANSVGGLVELDSSFDKYISDQDDENYGKALVPIYLEETNGALIQPYIVDKSTVENGEYYINENEDDYSAADGVYNSAGVYYEKSYSCKVKMNLNDSEYSNRGIYQAFINAIKSFVTVGTGSSATRETKKILNFNCSDTTSTTNILNAYDAAMSSGSQITNDKGKTWTLTLKDDNEVFELVNKDHGYTIFTNICFGFTINNTTKIIILPEQGKFVYKDSSSTYLGNLDSVEKVYTKATSSIIQQNYLSRIYKTLYFDNDYSPALFDGDYYIEDDGYQPINSSDRTGSTYTYGKTYNSSPTYANDFKVYSYNTWRPSNKYEGSQYVGIADGAWFYWHENSKSELGFLHPLSMFNLGQMKNNEYYNIFYNWKQLGTYSMTPPTGISDYAINQIYVQYFNQSNIYYKSHVVKYDSDGDYYYVSANGEEQYVEVPFVSLDNSLNYYRRINSQQLETDSSQYEGTSFRQLLNNLNTSSVPFGIDGYCSQDVTGYNTSENFIDYTDNDRLYYASSNNAYNKAYALKDYLVRFYNTDGSYTEEENWHPYAANFASLLLTTYCSLTLDTRESGKTYYSSYWFGNYYRDFQDSFYYKPTFLRLLNSDDYIEKDKTYYFIPVDSYTSGETTQYYPINDMTLFTDTFSSADDFYYYGDRYKAGVRNHSYIRLNLDIYYPLKNCMITLPTSDYNWKTATSVSALTMLNYICEVSGGSVTIVAPDEDACYFTITDNSTTPATVSKIILCCQEQYSYVDFKHYVENYAGTTKYLTDFINDSFVLNNTYHSYVTTKTVELTSFDDYTEGLFVKTTSTPKYTREKSFYLDKVYYYKVGNEYYRAYTINNIIKLGNAYYSNKSTIEVNNFQDNYEEISGTSNPVQYNYTTTISRAKYKLESGYELEINDISYNQLYHNNEARFVIGKSYEFVAPNTTTPTYKLDCANIILYVDEDSDFKYKLVFDTLEDLSEISTLQKSFSSVTFTTDTKTSKKFRSIAGPEAQEEKVVTFKVYDDTSTHSGQTATFETSGDITYKCKRSQNENLSKLTNGSFWYKYVNKMDITPLWEHAAQIETNLTSYWEQAYAASLYCRWFLPESWQPSVNQTVNRFYTSIIGVTSETDTVSGTTYEYVNLSSKYLPEIKISSKDSKYYYDLPDSEVEYVSEDVVNYNEVKTISVNSIRHNNAAINEVFNFLDIDTSNWKASELYENNTYYIRSEGGITWTEMLDKLTESTITYESFGGWYDMMIKTLKNSLYTNYSVVNYEAALREHNKIWKRIYSAYPNLVLEQKFESEDATTSEKLYELAQLAFRDYNDVEKDYSISVIDVNSLKNYTGQRLNIGDPIEINAEEYYDEYDNIKSALRQYLFITDISYSLRTDNQISLTVNAIKYQEKVIKQLIGLIR